MKVQILPTGAKFLVRGKEGGRVEKAVTIVVDRYACVSLPYAKDADARDDQIEFLEDQGIARMRQVGPEDRELMLTVEAETELGRFLGWMGSGWSEWEAI